MTDLDKLFSNNLIVLYFFVAISILNYSKLEENQKLIIIYIVAFLLSVFHIFDFLTISLSSLGIVFLYSQYLTEDVTKLIYLKRIKYKILDFIFMSIFQYGFLYLLASFFICNLGKIVYTFKLSIIENLLVSLVGIQLLTPLRLFFAVLVLFFGLHSISSQSFKIKSFDKIIKYFNPSINKYTLNDNSLDYFYILTDIEDRTYFERKKTYTIFSLETINIKVNQIIKLSSTLNETINKISWYMKNNRLVRGYSTLEMQFVRNIGIERGYNKTFKRKIFEIIYSKIIFSSIQDYFKSNFYNNVSDYKYYILYIYIKCVPILINGRYYTSIESFLNANNFEISDINAKECFFVACCGLKHARSTVNRVHELDWAIQKYNLNLDIIGTMLTSAL